MIKLRIDCDWRPPGQRDGAATEFGVQDKARALHAGVAQPDGAVQFEVDVSVEVVASLDELRLSGPFVHGKPGERFLYLGWRPLNGKPDDWIRRWKISLEGITPATIRELPANERLVLHSGEADTGKVWIGGPNWERLEFDRAGRSSAVA